ncbi:MAG: efflux RND transporter periplasmic adaptor subunit [Betaproteobacteria bacterium]|nr:efflux RND transporter periplasmic adaptor subunit [Betaproteobacteria bacterium]
MRILACSIALLAIAVAGCTKETQKKEAPRPALVRQISLGDTEQAFVYSGEVRARHEADLGFRVGGKILERRVNLGDRVRRGQLLARLDPKDVALAANAAKAQVAAAEADEKLAEAEYERTHSLAAKNYVSSSVVDQRYSALLAAQARLKQARSQADIALNQNAYANLLADRDGVVTQVAADAGQVVAVGQPVVRLADSIEREVLIYVPERRIAGLKPGAAALVRSWAMPEQTFEAEVREVGAAADAATRTYPVRVRIKADTDQFALGSTAAVAFPGVLSGSVVLPHGALVERDGKALVWVVEQNGVVQPRNVEVGSLREDGALIKAGLADGDKVVVVGAYKLVAGMKVTPVPESAPAALDVTR